MPESYQPGQRRPIYGQNHKISDERWAWVQTEAGKFLILVGEDKGHGTDVVLYHPKPGRQPDVTINLTNLTAAELDAMEDLITTAFRWARPVVEQRDKEADDAWTAGDDSHSRNYRVPPQLVYRKRPVGEHDQGVPERSPRVPEGGRGERRDHSGGVRGAGDELAQPDSNDSEAQHDRPTPDEPA